jgi:hypothetical protein
MTPKLQPLLTTWLASLIVFLAARYLPGLQLSTEQSVFIATGVLAIGSALTHRLVTPTARPRTSDGIPLVPEAKPSHTPEKGYPPPDRPKSRIYQRRPPPPRG